MNFMVALEEKPRDCKVVRIPPLENCESDLMRIHPDVVEVFQSQLAF